MEAANDALKVARVIVASAKANGYLEGELSVLPELADAEKQIFLQIIAALDRHLDGAKRDHLTLEEIASMFSFVFAKAAEAVTNVARHMKMQFDMVGLFDGKIPFGADDFLRNFCHTSHLAGDFAEVFLAWRETEEGRDVDPRLSLLEALKWTWRITAGISLEKMEQRGFFEEEKQSANPSKEKK